MVSSFECASVARCDTATRVVRAIVLAPRAPDTSGEHPIFDPPLRLAEFVATLALAQDNAFGQPLESQLRSCLLATWICEAAGFDERGARDRLLGRAAALRRLHRPRPRGRDRVRRRDRDPRPDARPRRRESRRGHARRGRPSRRPGAPEEERDEIIRMLQETAHEWAVHNFSSGCEVADMLVQRLDFGPGVREALRVHVRALERQGLPRPTRRARRSRSPMRVVHLSHDMEAIGRLFSPERALEAARDRRDRTYDPALADLFVAHGREWFDRLARDRAVGRRPRPRARAPPDARRARTLDDALTVAADFIDLKSPYMGGHSRRCAQLAADAARVLGLAGRGGRRAPPGGARARLRHHRGAELDLGQARPAHADGVRPRRAPPDADRADAAPLAGAGRPEPGRVGAPREVRRLGLPQARAGRRRAISAACVLAATEVYVGLTTERADRPPFSAADAAAELRRLESEGVLEPRASRAVLVAAGHGEPRGARGASGRSNPGGLSRREVDVLRLAAQGAHDAPDRRSARHLAQDRRPPHPAHLQQDRRVDASRRRAVGDAARRRHRRQHLNVETGVGVLDQQAKPTPPLVARSDRSAGRSSPKTDGDPRRSAAPPTATKLPHVQGLRSDEPRGSRTPDLLGCDPGERNP